ncbi:DNA repair protein rad14 [Polyrhizophydium stewartii]|uniref:DNA repair protein rad14 n=1 Tax=Polyrhizophydium stewartii TaxID=2732419 RepID=A0ABR4N7K7_9FUNG
MPTTAEQLERIAASRQQAQRRLEARQQAAAAAAAQAPTRGQEAAPAAQNARQRKKRAIDLTYCDYNLTTMHDTRGGFLLEPPAQEGGAASQAGADGSATAQAAGTAAGAASTKADRAARVEGEVSPDVQCAKCKSIDVDFNYVKYFGERVCRRCIKQYPDEYSLLTKTECREDYLLTESEMRDETRLPYWTKANPHKSTYSNMLLYLRKQVEAFAWDKWGSAEALDAEFERRAAEKQERAAKKYKKKLAGAPRRAAMPRWRAGVLAR